MSGSAAFILAAAFGENTAFTVFGGIDYRTSCVRGDLLGRTVADCISTHALRSMDDRNDGNDSPSG